jgi:O-antigen ligase
MPPWTVQSVSQPSRLYYGTIRSGATQAGLERAVAAVAVALGCAAACAAVLALAWFWLLLVTAAAASLALLAYEFPILASVAWLFAVGSTPEMWLGDLVEGSGSTLVAAEKFSEFALVAIAILRFGPRFDIFNPGLAFPVMFLTGLIHGTPATFDMGESLRSLAGSVAPFLFSWSRLSRRWAEAMINATCWLPLVLVAAGGIMAATGLRPLFRPDAGWRLAATSHPAFLAGLALTAVYACLMELFRRGRPRHLLLLIANCIVLILTGARAPLAAAVAVSAIAFLFLSSPAFGLRHRLPLLLVTACCLPMLVVLADMLTGIRIFSLMSGEAAGLSGREVIWPLFEQSWSESPWLGWGVGAAKTVMPEDSPIAHLVKTTAAHNEYLRIGVEGGYFGLGLLVLLLALWAWRGTRRLLLPSDRAIMRLVFIAFAIHSITDNTLIATTACVLFAWVSAVFARGALEREAFAGAVAPVCD